MLKFIKDEDENSNYPLGIYDMFDDYEEFEDEFNDEFDELFEEVNYMYYNEDSEETPRNESKKRILH